MSEIEQLTEQRVQIKKSQQDLQAWLEVKKNLSQKFKTPQEAFVSLRKEGNTISAKDLTEYAKGKDISNIVKELNEEAFIKAWEQWEFKVGQNEHTLQMIDEKLELIAILEKQDSPDRNLRDEIQNRKQIVSQLHNCDDLETLQQKLGIIVTNMQKTVSKDLIPDEGACFQTYLHKHTDFPKLQELTISRLQSPQSSIHPQDKVSDQQPLVESQIIYQGPTPSQTKTSYIEQTALQQRKRQAKPLGFQQGTFIQPNYQTKPTQAQFGNTPIPVITSDKVLQARDTRSKRTKQDLQTYIGELFNSQQDINTYSSPRSTKGLGGLKYQYFGSPSQQPQQQYGNQKVINRVQIIRTKLAGINSSKSAPRQKIPERPIFQERPVFSPDRPAPRSYSKGKQAVYTPGNTHRLNLKLLDAEKQGSAEKQQDVKQAPAAQPPTQQPPAVQDPKPTEAKPVVQDPIQAPPKPKPLP